MPARALARPKTDLWILAGTCPEHIRRNARWQRWRGRHKKGGTDFSVPPWAFNVVELGKGTADSSFSAPLRSQKLQREKNVPFVLLSAFSAPDSQGFPQKATDRTLPAQEALVAAPCKRSGVAAQEALYDRLAFVAQTGGAGSRRIKVVSRGTEASSSRSPSMVRAMSLAE